jgi:rhodanese-related sulfurtransferase/rubrerythrin
MGDSDLKELNSEELRTLMDKKPEGEYVLIDVRQPAEYAAGHIPGAHFLPLSELETRLFDLPADRDLVFYCRSGARSMAAAALAAEAEVTEKGIYNLRGGILAWDGKRLIDFPRVQVFEKNRNAGDQLLTAMDLEKGAWRFYRAALESGAPAVLAPVFEKLAEAETAHARAVYKRWAPTQEAPEPFDSLYAALTGDILEGGEAVDAAVGRLEDLGENPCLTIIELALLIEYSAYDLYRTVAEKSTDEKAKSAFLAIAQAEKAHMRMLTRAIEKCETAVESG